MCLADMTDTTTYARVAQLVEHDLAKVGAAGSSPVSRSLLTKKDIRWMSFFVKSSPAGLDRSRSSLRSGPRRADVHWTSCFSVPLRSLPNSVHRTLASSLRSGPRRTDVHWTSCAVSRSPSKPGYLKFSLRSSPRRADKFYLPLSNGIMIFR